MCARFCWCLVALLGYAVSLQAHTTSVSYADMQLTDQRLFYTLEVSPHDLAVLVGLAGPQDPLISLETFVAAQSRLADAVRDGIVVTNDNTVIAVTSWRLAVSRISIVTCGTGAGIMVAISRGAAAIAPP